MIWADGVSRRFLGLSKLQYSPLNNTVLGPAGARVYNLFAMNVPKVTGGQQCFWQQMVGPALKEFLNHSLGPPGIMKDEENYRYFKKSIHKFLQEPRLWKECPDKVLKLDFLINHGALNETELETHAEWCLEKSEPSLVGCDYDLPPIGAIGAAASQGSNWVDCHFTPGSMGTVPLDDMMS